MSHRSESHATTAAEPTSARCALLSGGGTGGHVFPALAIAAELARRGWRVGYAGLGDGIEARLVAAEGLAFHPLPARAWVGRGPLARLATLATLLRSALAARALVRRLDARVVVGTGGYVSVPAALGARLAARPLLLVEPNAEAGVANRWLSRLAAEAAVAFEETAAALRCPARLTGVPIRREIAEIAAELPPSPPLRLLVVGGSQGARQINELLPPALVALGSTEGLEVRHQCGPVHLEATRAAYAELGLGAAELELVPFIDDMPAAIAASHLVVSRAGAITLAELCAAGRPSLLVPLEIAGGHQRGNAERLERAGAARVLGTAAAPGELAAILAELLGSRQRLEEMAAAARALGRRDGAERIADQVERLGGAP